MTPDLPWPNAALHLLAKLNVGTSFNFLHHDAKNTEERVAEEREGVTQLLKKGTVWHGSVGEKHFFSPFFLCYPHPKTHTDPPKKDKNI